MESPVNNTLVNNLEEIVRWPQEPNRWKSKHSIGEVWESLQTTMQARCQCKERRKDRVGRSQTAAHGSKKDSVKQTGKFSRQKTPASCWSGPAYPPTLCSVFSLGTSGPCESMVVGREEGAGLCSQPLTKVHPLHHTDVQVQKSSLWFLLVSFLGRSVT